MRVSRAKAAASRQRIVDEAARLFRERGFDGIGVAELMSAAGLTHGGFYGHFASKEELMGEACHRAVTTMLAEWNRTGETAAGNGLQAIAARYLSRAHRNAPGTGCLMAALGPEASRQAKPVQDVVTECLGDVLDLLTRYAPGRTLRQRRRRAIATFASLVGALVIARAVNDAAVSNEVLETVAAAVGAATPTPQRGGRRRRDIRPG